MTIEPLFSIADDIKDPVTISFEGKSIVVPDGISVAAALITGGIRNFRSSIVGNVPRAPYCMMGVCFECLIEIDGVPARQSCLIPVREGMQIRLQSGALDLQLFAGDKQ